MQAGPTQQKLIGLEVVQLKGLKDMSLDFSHDPLTAIMGTNCSGKTTVLHALAAAYKPLKAKRSRLPFFSGSSDQIQMLNGKKAIFRFSIRSELERLNTTTCANGTPRRPTVGRRDTKSAPRDSQDSLASGSRSPISKP